MAESASKYQNKDCLTRVYRPDRVVFEVASKVSMFSLNSRFSSSVRGRLPQSRLNAGVRWTTVSFSACSAAQDHLDAGRTGADHPDPLAREVNALTGQSAV